jgi:hypothetical protein
VTLATTVPGQNAALTFDGIVGRRVSLALTSGSMSQEKVSLLAPDGSTVFASTLGNSGFVDVRTLSATGSYTIVVDPSSANVGSVSLTLYDVPPDAARTIASGGPPVTITTTVPGQNAVATFSGAAGRRISVTVGGGSMSLEKVSLVAPDGSTLVSATLGNSGFLDVRTLPVEGTYTLVVDPLVANIGSLAMTLYDVPPDISGAIAPGGSPVTVTTTAPGQNAVLGFGGTASRRVSLVLGSGSMSQEKVSLVAPDGSTVFSATLGNNGFVDARMLAVDGPYAVVVDPLAANVGSVTLTLYDVPPDLSGAIVPGGPPVTVTAVVPGQNARLAFVGGSGQAVTLRLSGVTMATVKVSVLDPDGTTLLSRTYGTYGGTASLALPTGGSYAIVVDPQSSATGSATVTLT